MNTVLWVLLIYATFLGSAWLILVEGARLLELETRSRLFALRDELFELGHSGTIPFNSEGYRFSEGMVNSMIRFAHDLSFTRLLVGVLVAGSKRRKMIVRYKSMSKSAQDSLDTKGKEAFIALHKKLDSCTAGHIMKGSITVFTLACVAMVVVGAWLIVIISLKHLLRSLIPQSSKRAASCVTDDAPKNHAVTEVQPARATFQMVTFTLRKTKVLRQADVEAMFNSEGQYSRLLAAA